MTRNEQHLQKLAEAFRGLASEYTWTPGDVREYDAPGDPGRCVCGHIIRIGYIWRHPDGHAVELGSDCTKQVPGLDERFARLVVADAIERDKLAKAEARRRAREERDAPVIEECLSLGVECDQALARAAEVPEASRVDLGDAHWHAHSVLIGLRHTAANVEWFRQKALRCVQPTVRRAKLRRATEEARKLDRAIANYISIILPLP
jgi:hypothetical protein